MEIWCVEAGIFSADDPSVDGELPVWIVTREHQEARWSAALLASLSSPWIAANFGWVVELLIRERWTTLTTD